MAICGFQRLTSDGQKVRVAGTVSRVERRAVGLSVSLECINRALAQYASDASVLKGNCGHCAARLEAMIRISIQIAEMLHQTRISDTVHIIIGTS
jgi:hypothetical protein